MTSKDLLEVKYLNNQDKYILRYISIGILIAIFTFIFQNYIILFFLIIYSHFDHKPDILLSKLKSDEPYITVRNIVNWEYSNFRNRNSWSIAYEMSKYNISGYQYFRKIKGYSLTKSITEILKLRLFQIIRHDIYYPYNIPLILRLNYSACGDYANIFVYLTNKSNITAYKLCATEDHCWNEYIIINGEKVIADPSSNVTYISSRTYFINPNWTHIDRIDLNRYNSNAMGDLNVPKSDYTEVYLKENATNLTIYVTLNGEPLKNSNIMIYSTVLSRDPKYRHLYRTPRLITYNKTIEDGIFKVTLRSNETYPLKIIYKKFIYCYKFETNLTVKKSINITIDLNNADKKTSILGCG